MTGTASMSMTRPEAAFFVDGVADEVIVANAAIASKTAVVLVIVASSSAVVSGVTFAFVIVVVFTDWIVDVKNSPFSNRKSVPITPN